MNTKLHSAIMIIGIVATGLVSVITALQAGGFNLGTGISGIIAVLIFIEHLNGGNTPANVA